MPRRPCFMPHAPCPMPHAPYPIPHTPYPIPHTQSPGCKPFDPLLCLLPRRSTTARLTLLSTVEVTDHGSSGTPAGNARPAHPDHIAPRSASRLGHFPTDSIPVG